MIQKGIVKDLKFALVVLGVMYSILFLIFVVTVNMDLYKLRIVFNYVNLHSNTGVMLTHLVIVWMFIALVLLIISNVNFPVIGLVTDNSSVQAQAYLMYQLEMVTMFVWMILIITVAVF